MQSISASIEGIIPEKAADWQANVPESDRAYCEAWTLDLYEPFVGRNVEFIIEPETPADETWRVIADANGSRVELLELGLRVS